VPYELSKLQGEAGGRVCVERRAGGERRESGDVTGAGD